MVWKPILLSIFVCFMGTQVQVATAVDLHVETVVEELEFPWGLAFLPSGEALITLKKGRLVKVDLNTGKQTEITGLPESTVRGQGGLLDVELAPDFEKSSWIYLTYSVAKGWGYTTELARAKLQGNTLEQVEILFTAKAEGFGGRHFGSRLAFDHEGYLYMSIGDRGDRDKSQELNHHHGKIVRLHADGRVPKDNPFLNQPGALPEIYSYGHRNPQGMLYDMQSKRLWLHEHGPKGGDELNLVERGANYGWPLVTFGREYSGLKITDQTEMEGVVSPAFQWTPSIAPSGIMMVDSPLFPDWQGDILVGALKFQLVTRVEMDGTKAVGENRFLQLGHRIRDIKQGPDNALYVITDSGLGQLWRITPK